MASNPTMSAALTREAAVALVERCVRCAMHRPGGRELVLTEASRLPDLGLTSLELVELSMELAVALRVADFPLMAWVAADSRRSDAAALTVGSLADACMAAAAAAAVAPTWARSDESRSGTARTLGLRGFFWVAMALTTLAIVFAALR